MFTYTLYILLLTSKHLHNAFPFKKHIIGVKPHLTFWIHISIYTKLDYNCIQS